MSLSLVKRRPFTSLLLLLVIVLLALGWSKRTALAAFPDHHQCLHRQGILLVPLRHG